MMEIALMIICKLIGINTMVKIANVLGMDSARQQEIKERIEKILAFDEFLEKEKNKSIIETISVGVKEIIENIKEAIRQLFDKANIMDFNSSGGINPVSSMVLKLLGISIIIVVLFLLVFIFSKNFKSAKKIRFMEDQELMLALKDAQLVEERAAAFAASGDYRQGIRHLYIALLLKLNEKDYIRIQKSKTNKQYMNELRNAYFKYYETVIEFTHDFNRFWYGNRLAGKENYEHWEKEYTLLKKEVDV